MKNTVTLAICLLLVPFFIRNHCEASPQLNHQTFYTYAGITGFSDSISYKIIDGPESTYGYDIYKNNRIIIHQPSIPCIKGNKGFEKKTYAAKVARLVIEKIRKNSMPPTLTLKEMKALGVI